MRNQLRPACYQKAKSKLRFTLHQKKILTLVLHSGYESLQWSQQIILHLHAVVTWSLQILPFYSHVTVFVCTGNNFDGTGFQMALLNKRKILTTEQFWTKCNLTNWHPFLKCPTSYTWTTNLLSECYDGILGPDNRTDPLQNETHKIDIHTVDAHYLNLSRETKN